MYCKKSKRNMIVNVIKMCFQQIFQHLDAFSTEHSGTRERRSPAQWHPRTPFTRHSGISNAHLFFGGK